MKLIVLVQVGRRRGVQLVQEVGEPGLRQVAEHAQRTIARGTHCGGRLGDALLEIEGCFGARGFERRLGRHALALGVTDQAVQPVTLCRGGVGLALL